MSRTGEIDRAQHRGPLPTSPNAVRPRGDQHPRAAGEEHPGPWTQPRARPKHALPLAEPPPLCAAAQRPLLVGLCQPAVSSERLGSNRPPARLAPSRPSGPSPAPPPTCCRRGRFHLHLPLTLLPARLGLPTDPPPARPSPPTGRQLPADPPQTPSKHAPPFTPPQAVCHSGRGCAGGPRGTPRKETALGASTLSSRSPPHTPATGR